MDTSNLSFEELKALQGKLFEEFEAKKKEYYSVVDQVKDRERVEDLKAKFSGLSAEDMEVLREAFQLSPSSVKTQEETKL